MFLSLLCGQYSCTPFCTPTFYALLFGNRCRRMDHTAHLKLRIRLGSNPDSMSGCRCKSFTVISGCRPAAASEEEFVLHHRTATHIPRKGAASPLVRPLGPVTHARSTMLPLQWRHSTAPWPTLPGARRAAQLKPGSCLFSWRHFSSARDCTGIRQPCTLPH